VNATDTDVFVRRLLTDGSADERFGGVFASSLDATPTFTEGGAAVVMDNDLRLFDAELTAADNFSGSTLTIQRQGGANGEDLFSATGTLSSLVEGGSLTVGGTSIGTVTTNSSGRLVLQFNSAATGSLVYAALRQLGYANSSNTPPSSVVIDWLFDDGNTGSQGTGSNLTALGSITVNIQNAADLTITVPASVNTAEDTLLVLSGPQLIQFDDGIAADARVQVTLSVAQGTLTLSSNAGVTFVEGADGTSRMVIEGFTSALNAAIDGLQYQPLPDYNGPDQLTVATSFHADLAGQYIFDSGTADDSSAGSPENGTLLGTAVVATDGTRGQVLSLDGTGAAVSVPGVFGNPSQLTLAGWVNLAAADLQGADLISLGDNVALRLDADPISGIQAAVFNGTTTETVNTGILIAGTGWHHVAMTVDSNTLLARVYVDGQLAAAGSLSGPIAWTQGTSTFIGKNGNGGSNHDLNGLVDDARIYTRALSADEIASLAEELDIATGTVAITVTPVNDAPVVIVPSAPLTAVEQTSLAIHGTGFSVSDVDEATLGAAATFSVVEGTLTISAGDSGVSVVSGNGTGSVVFTGSIAAINNLLTGASTGTITYLNSSDTPAATTVLTLSVSDGGNVGADPGLSGGVADEVGIGTTLLNITAINDAPVITSSGAGPTAVITLAENVTPVVTVASTDIDGGTPTYSVIGGADAARFTIDAATGTLSFVAPPDFEAPSDSNGDNVFVVTVQVSDGAGGTDSQTLTITITDVNESGITTIADNDPATNQITENGAIGLTTGITAFADDADGTDTVSYTLLDDAGGRFAIDSVSGVVRSLLTLDAEVATTHNITVQATSTDGTSTIRTFAIAVNDVDEFDVGPVTDTDPAADNVTENAVVGTLVGITGSASDADITTNLITWSLDDDAAGQFAIDATTGIVTVSGAIDREAGSTRTIILRATSADGSFSLQA
ncbi:MAG: cadherin domain-containing protein, partial [Planctomycetaceae bacterium]|nr:cadherin domain-containing protein [Planctomycetaceae bacterium]